MDNRRYSEESLRWVLKRKITIKNFTIYKQDQGRTELHYACKDNKAWIARACIAFNDHDINAPDEYGSTPLHLACFHSHVDVVKLLLESGAQPSLYHKDHDEGYKPIHYAIHSNKVDVVKLLLSYHEEDKEMALEGAFLLAVQAQNIEIVKLFLGVWPDIIHSRFANGCTALHLSCMRNFSDNKEVMEFLLASGAGVNAVNDYGRTPLFNAVAHGRPECAKVLLAAGANVNQRDTEGNTSLDIALSSRAVVFSNKVFSNKEMVVEVIGAAGGLTGAQLPDEDAGEDA